MFRRVLVGSVLGAAVLVAAPASATTFYGDGGANRIYGHPTDDVLRGMAGDDTLYGFPGNDQIFGGSGKDTLYGGPGRDTIWGGGDAKKDHISAMMDNDTIHAEGGDYVDAGRGNDTIYVVHANRRNYLHCAEGRDKIVFFGPRNGATVIACEKVVYR